jgi:hypothetical protein
MEIYNEEKILNEDLIGKILNGKIKTITRAQIGNQVWAPMGVYLDNDNININPRDNNDESQYVTLLENIIMTLTDIKFVHIVIDEDKDKDSLIYIISHNDLHPTTLKELLDIVGEQ